MLALTQYFLRSFRPAFLGWLSRILYSGTQVTIGRNFRTDGIPRMLVDKQAKVVIGDNVEFRRNVELRAHGQASIHIGSKCRIDRGVRILASNAARVHLSDGVRIGLYSVLNGGDSITVGKKSLISGFVFLQTSMHGFSAREKSIQDQGFEHAPVVLKEDCWLGAHVVVMPGVTIQQGGVVGSNAVVNKNVEAYQVVAGVPARPIKERV
jgi:acetyltransferase-like isoleucine patch superfamily enzyme